MSAKVPGEGPTAPAPLPTTTPTGPNAEGTPFPAQPPTSPAPQGQTATEQKAPLKKLFSLDSAPATVEALVHLPGLLPDYEPFKFAFRLTFSEHMQKKRDAFLALAPTKQVETEDDEILNEVCDLLAQDPTGFGDYNAATADVGLGSPGAKLRAYLKVAALRGENTLAIVKSVIRAANNIYWGKVTPREFFPSPTDNSAGVPSL